MGNKFSVNAVNMATNPVAILNKKVGRSHILIDKVAVASTDVDNANDYIFFGPIPSNAIITSIKIFNDDLDSNGAPTLACDVGLFYSGTGGGQVAAGKVAGDVISANCFATAITTLQSANVSGVEIRFEAGDIVDITKEAWELGGLSSDIGGHFLIGLDLTTAAATAAAGDIVLVVEYI